MPRTPRDLTPLQEGMYVGSAVTERPWTYLEQVVVHFDSERIEDGALKAAWVHVIRCHPVLHSRIEAQAGAGPRRVIGDADAPEILTEDWSDRTPADQDAAFATFLQTDRDRGIRHDRAPAFRLALFTTGSSSSKLVWTFPHWLLDGRSFAMLLDEAMRYYATLQGGGTLPEPVPEMVFEDHCTELEALSHEPGAAYFGDRLSDWEGGRERASGEMGRKRYLHHRLTATETTALRDLAHRTGVTPGAVVTAAWALVSARKAGREDMVLGVTLSGRHLVPRSREAVGCFIVTVPLRVRLRPGLSLGELLQKLRRDQIDLRGYEHTPLTAIRARTDVPPDRLLFDSVVMFETATLDAQMKARGEDWQHRRVELFEEGDLPMTVAAYDGDEMQITLEYDPIAAPDGPDMAEYMASLLSQFGTAAPETPLARISMLDTDEQRQLYALAGADRRNGTPPLRCLEGFEAAALRYPEKIALVQPGMEDIDYATLDRDANRLARRLIDRGAAPGDIIGICARRGPGFVTGMLACWKAATAFVPMDPSYPVATLRMILEDSGASLLLADSTAPPLDGTVLDLDADPGALSDTAPNRPEPGPDDVAYVIFTSGSSGRPKGVMISHHALAAHGQAVTALYKLSEHDRVLQFAALSFDVAIEEIVPTLAAGATLALRSDEMALSVRQFLEDCASLGVTVLNLPTGFWTELAGALDAAGPTIPPGVRLVIVGGERIPPQALRRWRRRFPELPWINGYGPTETTITCTAYEAPPGHVPEGAVPIGRPLAHARAWVLSADGALAPMGTPGELFISGPAVAQGYVGRPGQTAKVFREAAFDPAQGRAYATGDRACWLDGELAYLGRQDRQVKLRGFRIEPGQIERGLEEHPRIAQAHAAIHESKGAQAQLVAWYAASPGTVAPEPAELREWMSRRLPGYMLPTLCEVAEWPRTAGGKVDVARLPAPRVAGTMASDTETAGTALTAELRDLFGQVLGRHDIGPDTSFFEAGGTSLSLLRLLPLIEERFKISLKPTALYREPTPRGVERSLQAQDADPLVVIPIQDRGSQPPLYGVHVLGDNGSFYRPLAAALGPDQPVYGLTVGLLTDTTPTDIADIARFYLYQIQRHYPEGPLSLIAVSAGSYVTFELAHQLLAAGRDVQALILLDAAGPDGRPVVGHVGRVGAHLRSFMHGGWSYVADWLAARRENRAHETALRKLEADEAATGPDVARFIAANTRAIEAYAPRPYPKRLTILRAADNLFDSRKALETGLGWQSVAAAGFDLIEVPGGHISLLFPPNVDGLAEVLRPRLRRQP